MSGRQGQGGRGARRACAHLGRERAVIHIAEQIWMLRCLCRRPGARLSSTRGGAQFACSGGSRTASIGMARSAERLWNSENGMGRLHKFELPISAPGARPTSTFHSSSGIDPRRPSCRNGIRSTIGSRGHKSRIFWGRSGRCGLAPTKVWSLNYVPRLTSIRVGAGGGM